MSEFRVRFDTDNDAFGEFPEREIGNVLRHIAHRVEHGENITKSLVILDSNGNSIGRFIHECFPAVNTSNPEDVLAQAITEAGFDLPS